jgi:hypothetical protein
MQTSPPVLVQQKLEAFARLQPDFEISFQFLQEVHGQQRLPFFSVADCVRYLHARWVCECKGLLLSVSKTVKEYDGRRCLELLRLWQEQRDTASVVAFLHERLDMLPLADITRQLQDMRYSQKNMALIARLEHGRKIMLNRGIHLLLAMDTIFALSEEELAREVQRACVLYEHLPTQIQDQLELMDTPLYGYFPHQALAQCNMLVMNVLGMDTAQPADPLRARSQSVRVPEEILPPYAEEVIDGYVDMTSTLYNNVQRNRFISPSVRATSGGL